MTPIQAPKLFSTGMIIIILSFFILPNYSCSQSSENISLDGKKFTIVSMEPNKPETATMEEISFNNGLFDDPLCHIYGFTPGKYIATKDGENYNFEATMSSPSNGTEIYRGMIMGDKIHGEMVWTKEGQSEIKYAFSNMEHEITTLDGKVFIRDVNIEDSILSEEISFINGNFASPLCYQYGFTSTKYDAWVMDGKTMWQSLYKSEQEGWILFTGMIDGNTLSGSQFWHKEGQEDVFENFVGTLKK